MNVAEIKLNKKRNKLMVKPQATSNPFTPDATTDYEIKKAKEKQAIMDEIARISATTINV